MVQHHQDNAQSLLRGEISHFITGPAPPGDANILTYPPGYPIIMAIVVRLFDNSDRSMRAFQVLCDAAAAVLLFFVASQFLPRAAAVIAAVLAALSPQLAYYSLLLLPDSLATLPILLALFFLIRALKSPSLWTMLAAGVCMGLSCWLRSNALLLAPFLAVVVFFLMERRPGASRKKIERASIWRRSEIRGAVALVAATIIIIAPITIRNLIVFHRFIPLSLGAGQMLNVGIGDYDKERRFGLPGTDLETVTGEAAKYNRPEYANSLFGGNGVERDRQRFADGLTVIRQHPFWFASVLVRRSVSMFKLERVRSVSAEPAPSHSFSNLDQQSPAWSKAAADLPLHIGTGPSPIKVSEVSGSDLVELEAAADRQETSILTVPIPVEKNSDYLFRMPVRLEAGNLVVTVHSSDGSKLWSSPVLHPLETTASLPQPTVMVEVPFISRENGNVVLAMTNEGKRPSRTLAQLGRMELFRLGPSSLVWTKYFRGVIHFAQGFFITAWILPFACLGILLMWMAGKGDYLLVMLAIPLYYVCAQSFLHTEYRYVMAIHYSLFICVAAALYWTGVTVIHMIKAPAR